MLRSTATKLAEIDGQLGGIDFVLGFDCALRRLDAENRQIRRQMEDLYKRYGSWASTPTASSTTPCI